MHVGTHGSLEFTPWKQVALSSYDWPDVLIGEMPHYYLYIINNIGEAQIAKRRSYATMISHLTPPFMNSESYGG
jgi:cobaltochelatase CobN